MDVLGMALVKRATRNVLRGILPVASNFDVDPTNLGNITDGSRSNATGIGTKTTTGAGDGGIITIDTGAEQSLLVSVYIGAWPTSTGTLTVWLEESSTGQVGSWYAVNSFVQTFTGETYKNWMVNVVTRRYIRIRTQISNANTVNMRIYEISGVPYATT